MEFNTVLFCFMLCLGAPYNPYNVCIRGALYMKTSAFVLPISLGRTDEEQKTCVCMCVQKVLLGLT